MGRLLILGWMVLALAGCTSETDEAVRDDGGPGPGTGGTGGVGGAGPSPDQGAGGAALFLSDPSELPREFNLPDAELEVGGGVPRGVTAVFPEPEEPTWVAADPERDRVYAAGQAGRLVAIDLSDPASPAVLAETWIGEAFAPLTVLGDTLYSVETQVNDEREPVSSLTRLRAYDLTAIDSARGSFPTPVVFEHPGESAGPFVAGGRVIVGAPDPPVSRETLRTLLFSYGPGESGSVEVGEPLVVPHAARLAPLVMARGDTLWVAERLPPVVVAAPWTTRFTAYDATSADLTPRDEVPSFAVWGAAIDPSFVTLDEDSVSLLTVDDPIQGDAEHAWRFHRVRTSGREAVDEVDFEWLTLPAYGPPRAWLGPTRGAILSHDGVTNRLHVLDASGAVPVPGGTVELPAEYLSRMRAWFAGERLIAAISDAAGFHAVVVDLADAAHPSLAGGPWPPSPSDAPAFLQAGLIDQALWLSGPSGRCAWSEAQPGTRLGRLDLETLTFEVRELDLPFDAVFPWKEDLVLGAPQFQSALAVLRGSSADVVGAVEAWMPVVTSALPVGGGLLRLRTGPNGFPLLDWTEPGAPPRSFTPPPGIEAQCLLGMYDWMGWLRPLADGFVTTLRWADTHWNRNGLLFEHIEAHDVTAPSEPFATAQVKWSDLADVYWPGEPEVVTARGYALDLVTRQEELFEPADHIIVDVDLKTGPVPRLNQFTLPTPDRGPLLSVGDTLIISHGRPVGERVGHFLDRFDFSDPTAAEALPAINIPGHVLAYDDERLLALVGEYAQRFEETADLPACLAALGPRARFHEGRCARGDTRLHTVSLGEGGVRIVGSVEVEGDLIRRGHDHAGVFAAARHKRGGIVTGAVVVEDWRAGGDLVLHDLPLPEGLRQMYRDDLVGGRLVLSDPDLAFVDLRRGPYRVQRMSVTFPALPSSASFADVQGDDHAVYLSLGRGGLVVVPFPADGP